MLTDDGVLTLDLALLRPHEPGFVQEFFFGQLDQVDQANGHDFQVFGLRDAVPVLFLEKVSLNFLNDFFTHKLDPFTEFKFEHRLLISTPYVPLVHTFVEVFGALRGLYKILNFVL